MDESLSLENLLIKNNFIVTNKQLKNHDFSGTQIKEFLKEGMLTLANRGIYTSANTLGDPFYIAQLRFKRGIISLNTDLYLYGLSDRVPDKIDLTFPRGYKTQSAKFNGINPHLQIKKLYTQGIVKIKTLEGNKIRAYSLDRTMAEILREKNMVDSDIIVNAYKQYIDKPQKRIDKLIYFAKLFHTEGKARNYLEVLL